MAKHFVPSFAQNYGAGNYTRVKKGVNTALKIVGVAAICVMLLMGILGKSILKMFISSSETEALLIAWDFLLPRVMCLIICYLIHVYRNVLQGLGNAFWSFISGVAECALRIIMGKVIYLFLGSVALYFAEPVAWVGALLSSMLPYYLFKNKLLPLKMEKLDD